MFERNRPSARELFVGQSGEEGIAQERKEDCGEGVRKDREPEQCASRGKRDERGKQDGVSMGEEVLQTVRHENVTQDSVYTVSESTLNHRAGSSAARGCRS